MCFSFTPSAAWIAREPMDDEEEPSMTVKRGSNLKGASIIVKMQIELQYLLSFYMRVMRKSLEFETKSDG